jgi:SRSO17 transposase
VTDAELGAVRGRLEAFAMEVFAPMRRRDQRAWGCVCLRGLMLDGRRKSIQPIAERLSDGEEQCLQQFVNQSPWDWARGARAPGASDDRGDRGRGLDR